MGLRYTVSAMVCVVALLAGAAAAAETEEHWYVITMQGEPAGYMHSTMTESNGRIKTNSDTVISMKRMGTNITIGMKTEFVETEAGEPISMRLTEQMGMVDKTTRIEFGKDESKMTVTTAGSTNERLTPGYDGSWMPPGAASRFVLEQIEAGEQEIAYKTMDPMSGLKPMEAKIKVYGPEAIESGGKTVPATKLGTEVSILPGVETTSYIDDEGVPVQMSVNMGIISLTIERADKQLALGQKSAPEVIADTTIKPSKKLRNPRDLRFATYVLRSPRDLPRIPETSVQSVRRVNPKTVAVTVDLDANEAARGKQPEVTHSSFIDGRDKRIIALTNKATRNAGSDKLARARAMREFVYDYIEKKSLGVGFATASEVAQTKTGDCSEHGVLLAAMLRADDIPSRVASGVVYVEDFEGHRDIFGYHMWTQAYIDGHWVDLDATLGGSNDYDAAHIVFVVSEMEDGRSYNDMVELVPLIGRLQIEVVKP